LPPISSGIRALTETSTRVEPNSFESTTRSTPPTSTSCTPALNVDDLLAVINGWGSCPVPPAGCPADIAPPGGNDVVNVDDLLAVINGWGGCP